MSLQTKTLFVLLLLLGCSTAQNQTSAVKNVDNLSKPFSQEQSDINDKYHPIKHYNTVTNVPGGVIYQTTSIATFDTSGGYTNKAISTSNVFIPNVKAVPDGNGKYKLEKLEGKEVKNFET